MQNQYLILTKQQATSLTSSCFLERASHIENTLALYSRSFTAPESLPVLTIVLPISLTFVPTGVRDRKVGVCTELWCPLLTEQHPKDNL